MSKGCWLKNNKIWRKRKFDAVYFESVRDAKKYLYRDKYQARLKELKFLEDMGELKDVRLGCTFYFEFGDSGTNYDADFCYTVVSTGEEVFERFDRSSELEMFKDDFERYYKNYVFIENKGNLRKPARRPRY